jgi:hypothetical protein
MKKERQRTEKDATQMENKMKLLSKEEQKKIQLANKEKQSQEEMDKIRNDFLMEKMMLAKQKEQNVFDTEKKKMMIEEMRKNIKSALSNWRPNVASKNKIKLDNMKKQKIENEEIIKINKQLIEEKNYSNYYKLKQEKESASKKRQLLEVSIVYKGIDRKKTEIKN